MNEFELLRLYYLHKIANSGINPATGNDWTKAERMFDIIRQVKKTKALIRVVDWSVIEVDQAAIDEIKADLGL